MASDLEVTTFRLADFNPSQLQELDSELTLVVFASILNYVSETLEAVNVLSNKQYSVIVFTLSEWSSLVAQNHIIFHVRQTSLALQSTFMLMYAFFTGI